HAEDVVPRLRRLLPSRCLPDSCAARLGAEAGLQHIIGESPMMLAAAKKLSRIAACDATVLIAGETGTGKDMFARAIHYLSPRAGQAFVPVSCGAIPEQLVESELFGHRRGAFTGAVRDHPGLFAEADKGTLLLDEVEALPLSAQAKLLRFLQQGEFHQVGGCGL